MISNFEFKGAKFNVLYEKIFCCDDCKKKFFTELGAKRHAKCHKQKANENQLDWITDD